MKGSRELILARAREALGARLREAVSIPRDYRGAALPGGGGAADDGLLDVLEERVSDYGARVTRVPAADVAQAVTDAFGRHGVRRVCRAPGVELQSGGGVEVVVDQPLLAARELDRLDGVLTGCALAIAETGTIVLDGSAQCGRRAITLVPDLHVCLVRDEQVVARVPDAVAALAAAARRPLTFVSGPSATSDIGFERVVGVHGPRRLEIILVTESSRRRRRAADAAAH